MKGKGLGSVFNSRGKFMPAIFKKKLKNTIYFIFSEKARNELRRYSFNVTFFGLNTK